jgi:NAD(P)-dependent dehydrogenase (short-subunit alcohol dehydrogenase family)
MTTQPQKTAVVTGAAQGMGFAIAQELGRKGYKLVLLDRQKDRLQEAKSSLERQGMSVHPYSIDLLETDKIQPTIEQIGNDVGPFEVLVNNAGVNPLKPMDKVTSQDWDYVMGINVKAVFFLIQASIPYLRDGGSIINIASVAAFSPRPLAVAYAASKAGVVSVTKTAAIVLAPRKIRVNAVCPGATDTDMLSRMADEMGEMGSTSPQSAMQSFIGAIPLGRLGAPDDVARVVAFLASDDAAYITGQAINVCGGWTVK